jgi:hypothetical protein
LTSNVALWKTAIEWVDWLFFKTERAILQLYCGEKKLLSMK